MNLAVAFTEYQLLQIQALATHYKIENLCLIILDNDRIQPWLVDDELYEEVLVLPDIEEARWKRLLKSFIKEYEDLVSRFLESKERIDILIGAKDENTLFILIKELAAPKVYWNIEDGTANYYPCSLSYQIRIWLKKQLFKYAYGYDLPIAYGHGRIEAEKVFRMVPALSIDNNNNLQIKIGNIVNQYIGDKACKINDKLEFLKKYERASTLIVTNLNQFSYKENRSKEKKLYKFHPRDRISKITEVSYISEKIPIELLPYLLPDLEKIRFEVMSSSLLNLSVMNVDLDIEIAFKAKHDYVQKILDYITKNAKNVTLLN